MENYPRHKITNHGRHAIEVILRPGTVITKVLPGESLTGEIERIHHGDQSANYTCEIAE